MPHAPEQRTAAQEQERLEAELAMLARCVSDDLRQPLHVISGYAELVAFKYRDVLDPKGHQLIAKSLAGVERLNNMIDALVGLIRIDTSSPWQPDIDTNTLVDEVLTLLRPEAEPLGAVLERGDLPPIAGRPALIAQIFEQLYRNVLRFPGDSPPMGRLSAQRLPAGVRFSLKDQGPGLDPRLHRSIFEPFGRGQDPRAGAGMGLATCRKIVTLHGGTMGIESEAGAGATFWFELPQQA
jgi:signal transduction histidine kinase